MLRFIIIFSFISFLPLPGWAGEVDGARSLLCHQMAPVTHAPRPDVAYVPGRDVQGHPVVPADLNAAPAVLPPVLRVPLTVDLAQWLHLSTPPGLEMQAPLGMLEIHPDGRVLYNGQDLAAPLSAACSRITVE